MSPTSYQTAPPRSSIIINALHIVKLVPAASNSFQTSADRLEPWNVCRLRDDFSHPRPRSWHRIVETHLAGLKCDVIVQQGEHKLWPRKTSIRKRPPANGQPLARSHAFINVLPKFKRMAPFRTCCLSTSRS